MALTSGDDSRHLQRLAALVRQRRVMLGFTSKEEAAEACGISHTTYRKVEGTENAGPQRAGKSTYAKVDAGFGFQADACLRVADGVSDSIKLIDGTELIEDGVIRDFVSLEDEIDRAFDKSAQLVNPDQTLSQSRTHKEAMFRMLRERGVLKSD